MRGTMPGSTSSTSPRNSIVEILGQRWRDPEEHPEGGQQRQDLVLLGLRPEQRPQLLDLVGMLRGEVVRLAEVVGQVVQLGRVVVRVPHARRVGLQGSRGEDPGDPFGAHRQPPAVLVHGPVADALEVLLGVPFGRRGVGERVGEA